MDSGSDVRRVLTLEAGGHSSGAREHSLQRLPGYAACALLGLLGGITGVALTIALAIVIQLILPVPVVFAPRAIPLMLAAILAGLGITWLLGLMARQAGSELVKGSGERGQRVMLVFSVLAGTLQSLLFFALV
jgi:hypothetical protein